MSLPGIDQDPAQGDAGGIRDLASLFRSRSTAQRDRSAASGRALAALGPVIAESAEALRPRITVLSERFTRTSDAADSAAGILDDYATSLEDLQARAAAALATAQTRYDAIWARRGEALNQASETIVGWALGWDDVLPDWLYLDKPHYLARWRGAIESYRTAQSAYNDLQVERDELDSATAARLRSIHLVAELTNDGRIGRGGYFASAALWAEDTDSITAEQLAGLGDPHLIRQVWDSLDRAQRDALIEASPKIIGNLDGIPIADRVTANHINIEDEIRARQAEIERIEQMRADAKDRAYYGHDGIDAEYDKLVAEQQTLIDYYEGLLTQEVRFIDENGVPSSYTGSRVVVFDPAQSAIATYHGPIDPETGDIPSWVTSVAISVPGTGANMTDFADDRAADLYQAAGSTSAVFQWAGGPFPQDIPAAMDPSYSHALAPRLRDFAGGIVTPTGSTLTVLGHSYGGATVGLAEQAGLKADRILYVAAAGMGDGVSGVSDFPHTSGVPHYALMSRNDGVVGLIQGNAGDLHALHGQSTLTAGGVIRLETGMIDGSDLGSTDIEDHNVPGNWMPPAIDSHSSVFTPGSTSFNNMVAVITGGQVELFAPDEVIVTSGGVVTIDGIDLSTYSPTYTQVE
ncbi:alpha/beta hydrolase [Microbacterium sp. NPDC055910]|uniref:alpha/beta hydrolase n=1 Tax=Microbacterium sp. NPDC055910 TaxID=3345659 RepID=UPI0035E170C3